MIKFRKNVSSAFSIRLAGEGGRLKIATLVGGKTRIASLVWGLIWALKFTYCEMLGMGRC